MSGCHDWFLMLWPICNRKWVLIQRKKMQRINVYNWWWTHAYTAYLTMPSVASLSPTPLLLLLLNFFWNQSKGVGEGESGRGKSLYYLYCTLCAEWMPISRLNTIGAVFLSSVYDSHVEKFWIALHVWMFLHLSIYNNLISISAVWA